MTAGGRYRALRLDAVGSGLVAVDLPVPVPGPGEALIEVTAAGVCRSDVHYRSGSPKAPPLPRVLGHEIAGRIHTPAPGEEATLDIGARVALHYLVSCGTCRSCAAGREQFCVTGQMFGNDRDGGYAQLVLAPVRNLVAVPDGVDDAHAAVMMCSTATVHHALRRAAFRRDDRVAVFGVGGLGASAVKVAVALGAGGVYAIDPDPDKRLLAEGWGATPVDPADATGLAAIRSEGGVDVAVDLVGVPASFGQAVELLAPGGRLAVVGLGSLPVEVYPYRDIVGRELSILGVMDHLRSDVDAVLELAATGAIDLGDVVTARVPLEAGAVNAALDALQAHRGGVRTVIVPAG